MAGLARGGDQVVAARLLERAKGGTRSPQRSRATEPLARSGPGNYAKERRRQRRKDEEEDALLLARTRDDDEDAAERAIEAVFRKHFPLVRSIVRIHRVPASDAEDLYQHVRIALYLYGHRLRKAKGFLAKVATNACLDYHRRRAAEACAVEQYVARRDQPRWGARPPDSIEHDYNWKIDLEKALDQATPACQEIITKTILLDIPQARYAKTRGIPPGTIGPAFRRCIRKIKAFLGLPPYDKTSPGQR